MENKNKTQEELLSELTRAEKRISELEASIVALKAKEERYRQIVQNANSIILLMDTKGNITFFNQFAQRFFGFYERDILGKNVIGTIVSKKDLSGLDLTEMIKDIVENPERHSLNENENIRSNGERVRILWKNKAIIDDNGNIKEILCVGNEVTKTSK
jgi:PAS domain S-box-containing protein